MTMAVNRIHLTRNRPVKIDNGPLHSDETVLSKILGDAEFGAMRLENEDRSERCL